MQKFTLNFGHRLTMFNLNVLVSELQAEGWNYTG